ncbi:hypothetical protein LCI18_007794 [Fusarium solani-melongenae]|uniref:Uncharacterized protein n=1 Tax=Fusarium solani subsp. cucurbitae TaxID=2747967 RepID=A0ACD3Z6J4_FUSSC|nr:hypothetical protein LCI18_007794 [Fusarium solani-melongenae]
MSFKPVLHITGPNGELVPVCFIPIPAAADELISMEEWLEDARAFAQNDPPPAPKPTSAYDGFDVDKATIDELWAYIIERNSKAHLEDSDADAPKAKL